MIIYSLYVLLLVLPILKVHIHSLYLFIYFWLCWVFPAADGLSLVSAGRGRSVVVHRLLTVVLSLVVDHRP